MPLEIVFGDITKLKADAIVNAANSGLKMGGGVCGAIFAKAGAGELQAECDKIGFCPEGGAVITSAYALSADYIIHTVGPVWRGGGSGEEKSLRSCYKSALELAKSQGLKSVAFPLISSGIFGYPRDAAMGVAVSAIEEFLDKADMVVYLVLLEDNNCLKNID